MVKPPAGNDRYQGKSVLISEIATIRQSINAKTMSMIWKSAFIFVSFFSLIEGKGSGTALQRPVFGSPGTFGLAPAFWRSAAAFFREG